MESEGIICFQNPRNPLMVKAGISRHWMMNYSNLKTNSSFVIDPSQVTGEIAERGQISIIITRKPGRAQEDKMLIEYSGGLTGKTVVESRAN
ncbi:hypothetical protein OSTOST_19057 [Ostertagia ostertagi]